MEMRKILCAALNGLLSLLMLTSCESLGYPTVHPLPPAIPKTDMRSEVLPTPVSPGSAIENDDLRVTMKQAELTSDYMTEYGSMREPPAGQRFLWINILVENIGQKEHSLPAVEHFSVLYGISEFKSSYGYRKGNQDYSTFKAIIYQGQQVDAWLRFDVPVDASLHALQFVFLPASSQVSFSFPASGYPWADHPIFLWQCEP
jgi:hypothetical protein